MRIVAACWIVVVALILPLLTTGCGWLEPIGYLRHEARHDIQVALDRAGDELEHRAKAELALVLITQLNAQKGEAEAWAQSLWKPLPRKPGESFDDWSERVNEQFSQIVQDLMSTYPLRRQFSV